MKKECIAMLLAGGQGSRLYVLTENMAKPAVPFGGKFRIIDFPLSNCANAGIDTVGVLTQYRPLELNRYIGSGQPWDLDRADGGVHILPPYQSAGGASWYKGTANAIFQNIGFVDMYDPEYVLILSGDHIYKMNYAKMLAHHKKAGADCTISVMEVPWEDAPRFGIMNVDENDTITEFEEKPAHPKSNLASMGIYVFTWKKLREYLIEDESDEASSNDFGKNIIPKMLKNGEKMAAYRFSGYWKDVGTLDSLWDANMDMLATGSGLDLLEKDWPIYGRSVSAPPAYLGVNARVEHSVVARGCTVEGEAENSVLSERCTVEEGASVQYSILMPGAVVKKDARVSYAIIGENGVVGDPNYDLNSPFTPTSYYADNWDSLSNEEKNSRIYNMWHVRSVFETYEPGSVFKLITASVALEENITKTDIANDFYCNGVEEVADKKIQCWYYQAPYYSKHEGESLREALMHSCNPSFIQLGKRIGANTLYKYYKAFGLFDKTNSGLPGESSSRFHDLDKVGSVELATMSFGQRFTITPLQMITAICAIANNGNLLQPKIVKSMTNTDTGEVTNFDTTKIRQVLSTQTANQVKSMMKSVVTDGTGKNAQVQGYSIGGKSGTSEPVVGDSSSGYTTSFAAISPIENTQVAILVTLYDPKGHSHQGGQTAAPVVSKILSEVLPAMGIEPDQN